MAHSAHGGARRLANLLVGLDPAAFRLGLASLGRLTPALRLATSYFPAQK